MSARPTLPTTYNNLITSYVNGDLLVEGETSATEYRLIYTTLPSLQSYNIGYTINYTNTTAAIAISTYVNSPAISVPVGVYIVQGYANFLPNSSALYSIKLGINTTTSAFSNTYNYASDVLPAVVSLKSIHYTTYLSVATTTNFYFVFLASIAGNLNGTLNGKFIRIA